MGNDKVTPWERLETVFTGNRADRTPILGGWIACPEYIATLAQTTLAEYWENPLETSIAAYQALGTDGVIDIFVPPNRDDFRCVDTHTYKRAGSTLSLEEALAHIESMPEPEQIEEQFDFDSEYAAYRAMLGDRQKQCGDMVFMPARWNAGARITWYAEFGYENFFMIVGLYPKHAAKLMEVGGASGRCQASLVAKAVTEGIFPHAVLLGEDICSQKGPMVSPDFMEKHYAPQLRYGLEPLLAVGCKPVWHCDGDVRPMLDMLFDCGVQGLQGFQPECGMTIDYVATRRTREGQRLLIFGPLSVTTELPVLPPEDIRRQVRRAIEICRGNADLALFTANTINPDVPLENIQAMYDAVWE